MKHTKSNQLQNEATSRMSNMLHKTPPALIALLLQLFACGLTVSVVLLLNLSFSLFTVTLLAGVLAAFLSYFLQQAYWWWLIQLCFAPAALLLLSVQLPAWLFLGLFVLLLLMYWSTFRTQVPLYLSSKQVWQALLPLLPQRAFSLVDLGSGLGGVLRFLVRQRPDGHYTGVELAPLPCLCSWLRLRIYPQCTIRRASFWDCDLSQYDVVFAYLSPVPMAQLWQKACEEMKPGSLFISSTFAVPDHVPHQVVQVDDFHQSQLLIWKM